MIDITLKALIYDMQGRMLSASNINLHQTNAIDVSGLSEGMYFLRIINDNSPLFIGKVIKVKN